MTSLWSPTHSKSWISLAPAIVKDGRLAAAIEEAKLARRSRPGELPDESIAACMRMAGVTAADIDCVAVARPFSSLHLRARFPRSRMVLAEHHAAHAASA